MSGELEPPILPSPGESQGDNHVPRLPQQPGENIEASAAGQQVRRDEKELVTPEESASLTHIDSRASRRRNLGFLKGCPTIAARGLPSIPDTPRKVTAINK